MPAAPKPQPDPGEQDPADALLAFVKRRQAIEAERRSSAVAPARACGLRRAIGRCLLWFIDGAHPPLRRELPNAVLKTVAADLENLEERIQQLRRSPRFPSSCEPPSPPPGAASSQPLPPPPKGLPQSC